MSTPLLHHAYLVRGRLDGEAPEDFLRSAGLSLPDGASLVHRTYETLGIDDARALFDLQLRKTAETSVILIETSFMTREAQNALLKMLEEPSPRTHFIIVTSHPELLLPTLRSRVHFLDGASEGAPHEAGKRFVDGSYEERASLVTPFLPDPKLDRPADRSGAERFLREVVTVLHERGSSPEVMARVERLRGYVTDPSSSLKMILECVIYMLPV